VQCLVSADCGGALVCDPTTKTCTECTLVSSGACRADLAGAQCLTGGRCGCSVDPDCGGSTSGRVCDASISRCTPGCRGTGGNACPVSLICSSTTSAIGQCFDPANPPTDGGAGGTTGSDGGASDAGGSDAPADADGSGSGEGGQAGGGMGGQADDGGGSGHAGAGAQDGSATNVGGGLGRHITGGGCSCEMGAGQKSPWWTLLSLAGFLALFVRRSRSTPLEACCPLPTTFSSKKPLTEEQSQREGRGPDSTPGRTQQCPSATFARRRSEGGE
jgi:MYXO-CTERM domain-containing protein